MSENASSALIKKLKGRVLTSEQCVLKIIDHYEFKDISKKWHGKTADHKFFDQLPPLDESTVRQLIGERLALLTPGMKILIGMT